MELLFTADATVTPPHIVRSRHVVVHDGTRLAIDIHFPPGALEADPHPVIFIATQYQRRRVRDGREISMIDDVPVLQRLLPAGYVIAILDVRGTGASFGVKCGYDTPHSEPFRQDLADVLDWIGHQSWCNGRIGMYGYSFVAGTQLAAAMTGSPWLKCIAPQQVVGSTHRGYMNLGGIQNITFRQTVDALMWRLNVEQPAMPVDDDPDGVLLAAAVEEHRRMKPSGPVLLARKFADSRVPPDAEPSGYSGVATEWPKLAESGIALMHVGSWRDLYPDETLRLHAVWEHSNPTTTVIGAWVHGAQEQQPVDAGFDLVAALLAFYDRHLRPGEQAAPKQPAIAYRVLGAREEQAWRTAETWPPPQDIVRFHLAPAGSLAAIAPSSGEVAYQVDYRTGTSGLATRYTLDRGNPDYRGLVASALSHLSEPLPADRVLVGSPVLSLSVSCSQPDCEIFAYLLRVLPDGTALAVSEGFLRLSNRREGPAPYADLGLPNHPCLEAGQAPFPAGAVETVHIAMMPTAQIIAIGERLCLAIIGADPENWDTPIRKPAPVLTVHFGADSCLAVPFLVE